jgi:MarR family transcriptional regulator for hemolysin
MGAVAATQTSAERARLQLETFFKAALATRRFRARFAERVKSTSQTEARWSALYFLSHAQDGLIQSDLAERMGVQGPTLVRLLDALEEQELVKRTEAVGDRRAKLVVIQPAGAKIVAEVDAVAAEMRDMVFSGISDQDLATTMRVLDHVVSSLEPEHVRSTRTRRAPPTNFRVIDR